MRCPRNCGHRRLRSFPTRRSSDLFRESAMPSDIEIAQAARLQRISAVAREKLGIAEDRKSTRLNSSHPSISYAVFCLKKKKNLASSHSQRYISPCTIPHPVHALYA